MNRCPEKEPLKDRVNIILSKSGDFENDKIIVCRSMDELFCELKKYNSDDIFAIGGEEVYTQLLPYCCEAMSLNLAMSILRTDISQT